MQYEDSLIVLEHIIYLMEFGLIEKNDISNEIDEKYNCNKILSKVINLYQEGYFCNVDQKVMNNFFKYVGDGKILYKSLKEFHKKEKSKNL